MTLDLETTDAIFRPCQFGFMTSFYYFVYVFFVPRNGLR